MNCAIYMHMSWLENKGDGIQASALELERRITEDEFLHSFHYFLQEFQMCIEGDLLGSYDKSS